MTTEALAAVACLSPRQFTRLFRAETGTSPSKAVERLRLEAAKLMLEQSRLPIEEIARETGFANRERMRRAFLRAYGAGPRSVRIGAGPVAPCDRVKAGGPVQSAENVRNHDVNVRIRRCLSRLMV